MKIAKAIRTELRVTLLLLVPFVLFMFGVVIYFLLDACSDRVFATEYSPGNKFKAVIVERNCGATTSYNYIIKTGRSDQSYFLKDIGWVYGAVLDDGKYGVRVTWVTDSTIQVSYSKCRRNNAEPGPVTLDGTGITLMFAPQSDDQYW